MDSSGNNKEKLITGTQTEWTLEVRYGFGSDVVAVRCSDINCMILGPELAHSVMCQIKMTVAKEKNVEARRVDILADDMSLETMAADAADWDTVFWGEQGDPQRVLDCVCAQFYLKMMTAETVRAVVNSRQDHEDDCRACTENGMFLCATRNLRKHPSTRSAIIGDRICTHCVIEEDKCYEENSADMLGVWETRK